MSTTVRDELLRSLEIRAGDPEMEARNVQILGGPARS
jgi:hypothetical protein